MGCYVMIDYIVELKKPYSDLKTLIIGAILSIIPIVNFLVVPGFIYNIAQDTLKGKKVVREWTFDDAADYVIKSIMGIVISLVYMIIPIIILLWSIGNIVGTLVTQIISGQLAIENIFQTLLPLLGQNMIFIFIGAILFFIATFLLPSATIAWLRKGEVANAFKLKEVIKNALKAEYIIAWLILIVVSIVVGLVLSLAAIILAFIPVVGLILYMVLASAIGFALQITIYNVFAKALK